MGTTPAIGMIREYPEADHEGAIDVCARKERPDPVKEGARSEQRVEPRRRVFTHR